MKLRYAILVSEQTANSTTLGFLEALLTAGHRVYRVFFLHSGVEIGSIASEENKAHLARWQTLQDAHNLDLVLCSTSAIKRDIFDQREATRRNRPATLAAGFCLSGLGQWLDACEQADRIIRFGGSAETAAGSA